MREVMIEEFVNGKKLVPSTLTDPNPEYGYFGHITPERTVLTEVLTKEGTPLEHEDKFREAERLGVECVPLLHCGPVEHIEQIWMMLMMPSCLSERPVSGLLITPVGVQASGQQLLIQRRTRKVKATSQQGELETSLKQREQQQEPL